MKPLELMQLKIPAGYAITYNKFHDVDPVLSADSDDFIENWFFFTQDLMQIEKLKVKKGRPYIPDRDNTLLFVYCLIWVGIRIQTSTESTFCNL